jgi:small subunit ribosomal protein S9
MPDTQITHTIGRRKEAVCRVYLKPGSGKWDINGRTLGDYFPRPALVTAIQQPFTATDRLGQYDVKANVAGGGRRKLRDLGLLTRDARAVERKKPGRPKARKRFQFSKR